MTKLHWDDYIKERKEIMLGKPVFKGTRLTVELVLKALGPERLRTNFLQSILI